MLNEITNQRPETRNKRLKKKKKKKKKRHENYRKFKSHKIVGHYSKIFKYTQYIHLTRVLSEHVKRVGNLA